MLDSWFNAIRRVVVSHDEGGSSDVSTLSRRSFTRLLSVFLILQTTKLASASALPRRFGECPECGARNCHSNCAIVSGKCACDGDLCIGSNCWCAGNHPRYRLICDCRCDNTDCECTFRSGVKNICNPGGGNGPGDLF
jgi:hypothetical protein